ncbi:(Fe-S)-binding protein [Novispirillum itersonii]|uniref:(Fe-S)-binding protein n=1 Tax=Novispirillum itersonii TaxID=189 RepID=UPI00036498F7|nr:(Fe-S)-binding protein [Novispirillum itersonii]
MPQAPFPTKAASQPHVGLFVTCLADVYRPGVGFASLKLLKQAGCRVSVPDAQTCCGQPAWNSGDRPTTQAIAKATIAAFETFDYVVLPSGSCGGMLRDYPAVLDGDAHWQGRATALAEKTWELTSFLADVMRFEGISARLDGAVAYHDSCTGLRRLKIKAQPRALLAQVKGLTVRDLPNPEECCGFGGTFCVKYGDISNQMVSDKVADILATGADTLLAGDVGCLLNMAGKLKKIGSPVKVRHVAEVLADMADQPAIGEAEGPR